MNKHNFILIINALKEQYDKDLEHHNKICGIYGVQDVPLYDNTALTSLLIRQLQDAFPGDSEDESLIQTFIFVYNFGRIQNSSIKNAEELWKSLAKYNYIYHFKQTRSN